MASAFKVLSVPRCCRSRWLGRCPGGKCCRLRSFSALPLGRRTAAGKGCRMRREWEPEDLLACWTLMDPDRQLLANKAGATRLGFAVLLKFFELEARFPRHGGEVPPVAVAYLAQQVGVEAAEFTRYGWSGRAVKYHRAQIRQALGFRESTVADEDRLAALVTVGVADDAAGGEGALAELKADPGQVSLDTLLREVAKLARVRALALPEGLFADASDKVVAAWRTRAARAYPSDLRAAPRPVRLTLLAVLCWARTAEVTDALVDLLIALVLKLNTKAERRVEGELLEDLRRVRGKEGLLFALAEAAVSHPDDTVRAALFPVVGEATLRDLVREAKANEQVFRSRVRTVLTSSYTNHYRRMLPKLLAALMFRCNNTAYRPVMDALDLLARFRRPSPRRSRCTSATAARPVGRTCSRARGRSPTPLAASARCSPATPPRPGSHTTWHRTGSGTSCSPGSKPRASTTP